MYRCIAHCTFYSRSSNLKTWYLRSGFHHHCFQELMTCERTFCNSVAILRLVTAIHALLLLQRTSVPCAQERRALATKALPFIASSLGLCARYVQWWGSFSANIYRLGSGKDVWTHTLGGGGGGGGVWGNGIPGK